MSTGRRRTVYFSKRKDQDLEGYIKQFLPVEEFSHVAKQLMRDGIKYRKAQRSKRVEKANVLQSNTMSHNVIPEEKLEQNFNFSDVELKKKEVDDQEIEDKIDSF